MLRFCLESLLDAQQIFKGPLLLHPGDSMDIYEFYEKWKEPTTFEVEVVEAKYCRAGHNQGEKFTFAWNTPEGLCGEAFVGMYPVLCALRTGGDMRLLGSEEKHTRVYTCPSRVVKFRITACEQCVLCGKREGLKECEIAVGDHSRVYRLCPECAKTYGEG